MKLGEVSSEEELEELLENNYFEVRDPKKEVDIIIQDDISLKDFKYSNVNFIGMDNPSINQYEIKGENIAFKGFDIDIDKFQSVGRLEFINCNIRGISLTDCDIAFISDSKISHIESLRLNGLFIENSIFKNDQNLENIKIRRSNFIKIKNTTFQSTGNEPLIDMVNDSDLICNNCLFEGEISIRVLRSEAEIYNSRILKGDKGIEIGLEGDVKVVNVGFECNNLIDKDEDSNLEYKDCPQLTLDKV